VLRRLIRDPLVLFVGAGTVVYLLYASFVVTDAPVVEARIIRVTPGTIAWMTKSWEGRMSRPPTPAELKRLIDTYVRETVFYREALAMGLGADDTIVRRRLAQKLEFLTQDIAQPAVGSDAELKSYMEKNRAEYEIPARVTITHIYFNPDKRGENAADDARARLAKLKHAGTDGAAEFGDRFMLQSHYAEKSADELARLFGRALGQAVLKLPIGSWQGPVSSGYGVHLVYVHDKSEPAMPALEDVRERVKADWLAAKRTDISDRLYATLRERYEVIVEDGE